MTSLDERLFVCCAQLSDPLPAEALEGVVVTVSDVNQDCNQACSKSRRRCSAKHMQVLNSCDRLREKVGVLMLQERFYVSLSDVLVCIVVSADKLVCFVVDADKTIAIKIKRSSSSRS